MVLGACWHVVSSSQVVVLRCYDTLGSGCGHCVASCHAEVVVMFVCVCILHIKCYSGVCVS